MFRRGNVFYCEDRSTGQQKSLQTRDEAEAQRIIQAKNDAVKLPQMNLVMAKTYLSAQNPKMITRTWADVMERFCNRSNDNTRMRQPLAFQKLHRLGADDALVSWQDNCDWLPSAVGSRWMKPAQGLAQFA